MVLLLGCEPYGLPCPALPCLGIRQEICQPWPARVTAGLRQALYGRIGSMDIVSELQTWVCVLETVDVCVSFAIGVIVFCKCCFPS